MLHQGWPRCHFRDGNGNTKAIGFVNGFPTYVKAGDGKWHTFICERTVDGVRATIDPGDPEGADQLHPRDHRPHRQRPAAEHRRQGRL